MDFDIRVCLSPLKVCVTQKLMCNRLFSYSERERGLNDISLHFVEFSNVHHYDRYSNTIQSSLAHMYRNIATYDRYSNTIQSSLAHMYRNIATSRLFRRIAERSLDEYTIDLLATLKTNVDRTIFHYNL